jgi:hypothetical protein
VDLPFDASELAAAHDRAKAWRALASKGDRPLFCKCLGESAPHTYHDSLVSFGI